MISLLQSFTGLVFTCLTFDYVIVCVLLVFLTCALLMIKSLVKGR